MACIDLSSKFNEEKPTIKLKDDLVLTINDSHKDVLIANGFMSNELLSENEKMEKTLAQLLGKKGVKKIEDLNLRFVDYRKVFFGVIAAVNDEKYEDVEKRFRAATK